MAVPLVTSHYRPEVSSQRKVSEPISMQKHGDEGPVFFLHFYETAKGRFAPCKRATRCQVVPSHAQPLPLAQTPLWNHGELPVELRMQQARCYLWS